MPLAPTRTVPYLVDAVVTSAGPVALPAFTELTADDTLLEAADAAEPAADVAFSAADDSLLPAASAPEPAALATELTAAPAELAVEDADPPQAAASKPTARTA